MTLRHPLARTVLAALTGVALAAAGVAALAEPPRPPSRAGYAPDPAASPSAKHWVFEVLHTKGKSSITRAWPVVLARPAATARQMGRFAIELYVGTELLDRIRFDVPLTGDAPEKPTGVLLRRPTFDEGVTTRLRVRMADNPRARWAKLVDRKTGAEQRFMWPPEPNGRLLAFGKRRPAARDGGTSADAGGPPVDAGKLPADAGWPRVDAGKPPADAGWPPADAGWPRVDAGKPPADAGWPPADAGWPPVDAGWALDAGRPRGK